MVLSSIKRLERPRMPPPSTEKSLAGCRKNVQNMLVMAYRGTGSGLENRDQPSLHTGDNMTRWDKSRVDEEFHGEMRPVLLTTQAATRGPARVHPCDVVGSPPA